LICFHLLSCMLLCCGVCRWRRITWWFVSWSFRESQLCFLTVVFTDPVPMYIITVYTAFINCCQLFISLTNGWFLQLVGLRFTEPLCSSPSNPIQRGQGLIRSVGRDWVGPYGHPKRTPSCTLTTKHFTLCDHVMLTFDPSASKFHHQP